MRATHHDPSKPWSGQSSDAPQFHHIMISLGAIIYALNYCSVTMSNEAVDECQRVIESAKSYGSCEEFSDTTNLIDALPTKPIYAFVATRAKEKAILEEASGSGNDIRNQVREMGTLDSFRSIIVTLVTSAKSEEAKTRIPPLCRSIGEGFAAFDWKKLQFDLADYKNLNTIKPLISALTEDIPNLSPEESIYPCL